MLEQFIPKGKALLVADKKNSWREIGTGIINFLLLVANLLLVTQMMSQCGLPYEDTWFLWIICLIIFNLWGGWQQRLPLVGMPSLGVNSYLCYQVTISQGIVWQQVLVWLLGAGILVLLLEYSHSLGKLLAGLPPYLADTLPVALGLFVMYRGLLQSHLVIGAAFQITTAGSLGEPLVFASLWGLLVGLLFCSRGSQLAPLWGILTSWAVLLALGYCRLPEIWFMIPSNLNRGFWQFESSLTIIDLLPMLILAMIIAFDALGAEKLTRSSECGPNWYKLTAWGAVLGSITSAGALSMAEARVISVNQGNKTRLAVIVTSMLLLLVIFCAPGMWELAKQPTITGVAMILLGGKLVQGSLAKLVDRIKNTNNDMTFWPILITLMLIPLWGDLVGGIAAGVVLYTIMKVFSGQFRELPWVTYILTSILLMYLAIFL